MEVGGNNRVVIAFGSNLGDKEAHIQKAIDALSKTCGKVVQVSAFYRSAPEGFVSENEFVNGCLLLLTDLNPYLLLKELKAIEKNLGRIQNTAHYEDRCIDLDIIFYESLCIQSPDLQIPHPRYHEREFVMVPLQSLNLDFNPL
ncbi:MAG: 2-amino-4-hydroxy-6-hydroxymethyldihydropteridine diphosphokinase [Bacteroidota bacterium]|jgi:2-amino-4-hydroxy-6-hydroxymethyldihydropteridine diphosphokinase